MNLSLPWIPLASWAKNLSRILTELVSKQQSLRIRFAQMTQAKASYSHLPNKIKYYTHQKSNSSIRSFLSRRQRLTLRRQRRYCDLLDRKRLSLRITRKSAHDRRLLCTRVNRAVSINLVTCIGAVAKAWIRLLENDGCVGVRQRACVQGAIIVTLCRDAENVELAQW